MPGRKPRLGSNEWQLQQAKARLSEVFSLARSRGPQRITRHGKEAVVMVPAKQFDRLMALRKQPKSLVAFFSTSPLADSGIDLAREADYGRRTDL